MLSMNERTELNHHLLGLNLAKLSTELNEASNATKTLETEAHIISVIALTAATEKLNIESFAKHIKLSKKDIPALLDKMVEHIGSKTVLNDEQRAAAVGFIVENVHTAPVI